LSKILLKDAETLRSALASNDRNVSVSLSRETAEFVFNVVDAKARGREVLIVRGLGEVSPTEAALILGMSRPQVRKIMDSGRLPYHMVGTHHRIAVHDLKEFQDAERIRRKDGMHELMALQNELGL
jgi:excisionase family DNA binding protein